MKRVLITGKNSYVGTSFAKYVKDHHSDSIITESISVRGDEWRQHDFSQYDVILHVAGIAHVSTKKSMEDLYYKVNRDLTLEVASKAKDEGVKQFIFLSSIIVYGNPEGGRITKETIPNPTNFYGRSKLEAEEGLQQIETENFKVCIVRPPMIYGPGSKGNYLKLSKLAKITPFFPNYPNKRSMVFINNLSNSLSKLIMKEQNGISFPKNKEHVKTFDLVSEISKLQNKNVVSVSFLNSLIAILVRNSFINKIFGNLYFDFDSESDYTSFEKSIEITEGSI